MIMIFTKLFKRNKVQQSNDYIVKIDDAVVAKFECFYEAFNYCANNVVHKRDVLANAQIVCGEKITHYHTKF